MEKVALTFTDSGVTPELGTPAATGRVFTPGKVENGIVHTFWNTFTGLTGALKSKFTASLRLSDKNRPTDRAKFVLSIPQIAVVDGIDTVAHVNTAFVEFVFHKDASRDARRDLRTLTVDAINRTEIATMITELEDLY